MNKITELDLAYIAGIIDGEGSVFYCSSGKYSPRPVVSVKMTSYQIPRWLCKITGIGSLLEVPPYNKRCRPQLRWNIVNRQAETFLEQIVRFLKLKQPQARLILKGYKNGDHKKAASKVKELNRRGA